MFHNFYQELSKKDKQLIRELMDLGLQREFEMGIGQVEKIIDEWKTNKEDRRATYHAIHDAISQHRKHLAYRYDGLGGSKFVPLVGELVADNIITEADLEPLSNKAKEIVLQFANLL
jgi:hypothetical protein